MSGAHGHQGWGRAPAGARLGRSPASCQYPRRPPVDPASAAPRKDPREWRTVPPAARRDARSAAGRSVAPAFAEPRRARELRALRLRAGQLASVRVRRGAGARHRAPRRRPGAAVRRTGDRRGRRAAARHDAADSPTGRDAPFGVSAARAALLRGRRRAPPRGARASRAPNPASGVRARGEVWSRRRPGGAQRRCVRRPRHGSRGFTLDLGHAKVAGSLIAGATSEAGARLVEALATKDEEETRRRAERAGIRGRELDALVALPGLYGGHEVWERADRVLAGTSAEAPARELRSLYDTVVAAELWPSVVASISARPGTSRTTPACCSRYSPRVPARPSVRAGATTVSSTASEARGRRPASPSTSEISPGRWNAPAQRRAAGEDSRRGEAGRRGLRRNTPRGAAAARHLLCRGRAFDRPGLRRTAWRYPHFVEASARGSKLTALDTGTTHSMEASSPREVAEAALAQTRRTSTANSEGT